MFSIGLEFSLPRLKSMRRIVFGLGGAQVALTVLITLAAGALVGRYFGVGLVGHSRSVPRLRCRRRRS